MATVTFHKRVFFQFCGNFTGGGARMKRVCPCCNGDGVVSDEDALERLKAECREMGIPIAVGGTITETNLARLLGKAPNTIRNWRMNERHIEPVKIGGRVWYRLSDVAMYLEGQN